MSNPKIDWSDLENVEPVTGGCWDGCKIVAHYPYRHETYPHLAVLEDSEGKCFPVRFTDDGRDSSSSVPVIRNKPKRVKLEECWVVYTPDGQYRITVFSEEAAGWAAGNCDIVRHIPAENVEV